MTEPPAPAVSIVIPVFNQWRYTAACLEALEQTCKASIPVEVIVVDNASTDETAGGLEEWRRRWPAVRVERLPANVGFSPASNRGAELSRGEHLVFLNNDTVPQAGWLETLLGEIQSDPAVGITAPKLLYPEIGKINHAGYAYGRGMFHAIYHGLDSDFPGANKKRDYQALLGACLLMRRDLFFSVGQFSLDGLEDIDLCLKLRPLRLACRYVPAAVVLHHGSVTISLSTPGSVPVTDGKAFGARWVDQPIWWDDYAWYLEDGFWPMPPPDDSGRSGLERAHASVKCVIEAQPIALKGGLVEAKTLIQEARRLWPQNPFAYVWECSILAKMNRLDDLHEVLRSLRDFTFYPPLIDELLPSLAKVLPPESLAELTQSDETK